jgi:hypothetical protein
MEASSYPTYEDAVRDYLGKLNALTELPHSLIAIDSQSAEETASEHFIGLAEELADISSGMILPAQKYQTDSDPLIREGILCHFIDQATTELLLEVGLLQIMQEKQNGIPCSAAIQATHGAALREAINAAEKSLARPVARGLAIGNSYRITDSSNVAEAASAFKTAFSYTAGGISRRVQELGSDIAIELISGAEWNAVFEGDLSSQFPIKGFLESLRKNDKTVASRAACAAGRTLQNVYEKVGALACRTIDLDVRKKIRDWVENIMQTQKADLFNPLVENLYGLDGLIRSMERSFEDRMASLELINSASDLIKTYSDKFIILTARMRKLEDAIRLGKLIQLPQLLPIVVSLQVELLAALVYAGYDYINRCENSRHLWKS